MIAFFIICLIGFVICVAGALFTWVQQNDGPITTSCLILAAFFLIGIITTPITEKTDKVKFEFFQTPYNVSFVDVNTGEYEVVDKPVHLKNPENFLMYRKTTYNIWNSELVSWLEVVPKSKN